MNQLRHTEYVDVNFEGEIHFSASDIWEDEIIYTREGADLQEVLTIAEENQPNGQALRTISAINWDSNETPPSITVTFSQPD